MSTSDVNRVTARQRSRRELWDELAALVARAVEDGDARLGAFVPRLVELERRAGVAGTAGTAGATEPIVVARRFGRVHAAAVRDGDASSEFDHDLRGAIALLRGTPLPAGGPGPLRLRAPVHA